ncbi:transmembrane protein, putative [Medicago truncatula]|nr:transmembrane protein, putative [Medicago truncatula]
MGEKVTSIFEHAIRVFGRKDAPVGSGDNDGGDWQVDVDMIDGLFASLVEYLQLENAYNIFILNPKRAEKKTKYGYRRGLSESEFNFLKENKTLQTKLLQSEEVPENTLAFTKIQRPLYVKHPMMKFAWTRAEDSEIVEWYNIWLETLNNFGKLHQGKEIAQIIEAKALQLLKGKDQDLKLFLERILKSGDYGGFQAECLTDTWIGKNRWAFIDLSAGPFSWGPAVGGDGVRTEASLPNVERTIGSASEISEEEAEDLLQDAIHEKFAVFGDKEHQAIDILLAEIDIYELFAFKHCKGRKGKLALCDELDERMRDLKNELQSFEGEEYDERHKAKAIETLKRMEGWNLFSDTHEEFQNYTVARDSFLAHLGATLWGSMRHIVSPSVSDGAFHYYEKISFQLFFMTQEKVRHIKELPVDMNAIKDGLSSLMVPSQKPMFSPHMLPLSDDPDLAMAFAVARRAAAVPLLLVNGTYRKTIRTYLDSSILQYQLQRLNKHGSLKGRHAHSRSMLEVPIFWFIHSEPLLLDKHFQAIALSDMIIVVQSEPSSWESHLHCNGHSLLLNLRQPIKAAVAATAEHLAGLLPLHLVYGQAHETAMEDWIWSAGCNPFSATSQGWHISQFQSDSIARSYVITTLEESILLVNSAIHRLLMERTTQNTFKIFQSQEHELVNKYNYVVSLWRRASTVTGELRYVDALRLLNTLEDASKRFVEQVNTTLTLLHPINCTRERKMQMVFDMTTIPAFLIVLGCLYMVLRPRRPKPKIN